MNPEPPTERRTCAYGVDTEGPDLVVVEARRARGHIVYTTTPPPSRSVRTASVAALPAASLFTRKLHAPFASGRKAHKVFPSLLDIQLPCPLEDCLYGFIASGSGPGTAGSRVLGVAARCEDVQTRLEALADHGIDPEQLEHEGLALWAQSLVEQPPEAGQARIVCRLGFETCTFAFGVGSRLDAVHPLRRDLASAPLDEATREAFVRRARQLIQGSSGKTAIAWFWTGPGAEDETRVRTLESALSDGPLTFHRHEHPAAFLARALARRGLVQEPTSFNFRRGPFAHRGASQRAEHRGRRAGLVALLAGLVLIAGSAAWELGLQTRNQTLQHALTRKAKALSGLATVPRGQEVEVVTRELARQAERDAPFARAFEPELENLLSTVVAQSAAYELELESVTLRDGEWTVRGTSDDWNRCDPLKGDLENLGYSVEAKMSEAGADERVHFTFRGEPRP